MDPQKGNPAQKKYSLGQHPARTPQEPAGSPKKKPVLHKKLKHLPTTNHFYFAGPSPRNQSRRPELLRIMRQHMILLSTTQLRRIHGLSADQHRKCHLESRRKLKRNTFTHHLTGPGRKVQTYSSHTIAIPSTPIHGHKSANDDNATARPVVSAQANCK